MSATPSDHAAFLLDNFDRLIDLVAEAPTLDEAVSAVATKFSLSESEAREILSLPLAGEVIRRRLPIIVDETPEL